MKKLTKILSVLIMMIMILSVTVNAASSGQDPSKYTGGGASVEGLESIGNQVIQIVSTVGSIASVIVLIVLGLKYMMGSAEEKAEYKKTLMPYFIGAAMVFAASSIAAIVFSVTSNLAS